MDLKKKIKGKQTHTEFLICVCYVLYASCQLITVFSFSGWESQGLDDYVNSLSSHWDPFVIQPVWPKLKINTVHYSGH